MADSDERDLAAEIDELRERQAWAEERIRTLADAVQRLAEEISPPPVGRTARHLVASRLENVRGRGAHPPPHE
jgi:hypothetical protein